MNYETISDDVADIIMGSLKISGWISGVDGTRIIWYENRFGKTQKLMTQQHQVNGCWGLEGSSMSCHGWAGVALPRTKQQFHVMAGGLPPPECSSSRGISHWGLTCRPTL